MNAITDQEKLLFAMKVVEVANDGDHPCPVAATIKQEDVMKVFVCDGGDPGTNEEGTMAVFRMRDGRYIAARESSDYSGHG
ncbi:MAG TPA: hypothetical protein VI565_06550 [Burkholderiales bacterium]|nr:hypothetical protein [Burkholderiales bacterium]